MKITVFLRSLHGGGAERVMLTLANEFVCRGHSVDMVLMMKRGAYIDEIHDRISIINLECSRPWNSIFPLIKYLRKEEPDIVLSAMPIANSVSSFSRAFAFVDTRVVVTEHNSRSLVLGDVLKKRQLILLPLVRLGYVMADEIVAVSKGVSKKLKGISFIKEEKINVINNPIFSKKIREKRIQEAGHEWFEKKEKPIVISAGRIVEQKGFEGLIESFLLVKEIKRARLVILGEGGRRKELEKLVSSLGLEEDVWMPGFVENPWKYMARADLFVLSSKYEGFGNVLVEAMACGTPVVSTDCPTGPRMILADGEYGELVPVGETETMAHAIVDTLESPPASQPLIDRAGDFSVTKSVEKYLDIMKT